jgi:hypothetical protein
MVDKRSRKPGAMKRWAVASAEEIDLDFIMRLERAKHTRLRRDWMASYNIETYSCFLIDTESHSHDEDFFHLAPWRRGKRWV